ncbi:hypothetical protein [Bremerella alba]|uniref:Uncharacterized protein n=1 Tax=Bremerella alba TaxID=980252 RepID=A0A7V8V902_9BACT|nr:hypothetical protein [Bremerella alba]MBA2117175.1 hypothetical protein [Bremerella alba]
MKLKCPNCDIYLSTRQMNVDNDLAICHDCNEAYKISTLLEPQPEVQVYQNAGWISDESDSFNIDDPPSGTTYENYGMGWRIAATTRSASAFFLIPFIGAWSGFSMWGLYGTQIQEGEFDLFRTLFGIPFVLGTLLFGSLAVLSVIGRMVVKTDEMDHDAGSVFLGVGPIGSTTRFRWSEVRQIDESLSSGKNRSRRITLYRDNGDIHFGSMLSNKRRRYVIQALRQLAGKGR